jgi:hypothetical protein
MSNIIAYASTALLIVGVLAFLVSVITEVLKGIFAKLPTDILVVILSVVLSIGSYFAYISYVKHAFAAYELAGVVVGAFIVAFIAMYGWQKLTDLYSRFKVPTDLSSGLDTLKNADATLETVKASEATAEPIAVTTNTATKESTDTSATSNPASEVSETGK